jgi:spore coat polysaccharide biosynthesis predicted glycosyltransferase SpsG/CMP-N-acetylneuraminic acid synthetase
LYYSIRTTTASRHEADVVVSSEDEEIRMVARKLGAGTINRDPSLSQDDTTLDGVIHDAMLQVEAANGKTYDLVITAQATSPLLETRTLDEAIDQVLADPSIDTMISAVDDRHLSWEEGDGELVPAYSARLNRQYLPVRFRETGGFFIARRRVVTPSSRFGATVRVYPVSDRESIDIDTYADWALCEYYLTRKRVLMVTTGYPEIGLGHVYNLLAIAGGMVGHELIFLVDDKSRLAMDTISSYNYLVSMTEPGELVAAIKACKPDTVINDRLDTTKAYMDELKATGATLINFEDLGPGAAVADLVINAMYPERAVIPNHYFGHRYFCLRSEFLLTRETVAIRPVVEKVLLTFGGVDPNNYTRRVLSLIVPECRQRGISVRVILGRGYQEHVSLEEFSADVEILSDVVNMSELMLDADLAFTSAGRTTFETASLGLPTVVICQNQREMTHFFAGANYGFRNLGLGTDIQDDVIRDVFLELIDDAGQRGYMSELMLAQQVKSGRDNVLQLIKQTIDQA